MKAVRHGEVFPLAKDQRPNVVPTANVDPATKRGSSRPRPGVAVAVAVANRSSLIAASLQLPYLMARS